ncbi:MATE family efflux transporter [Coprobacillus sp. AM42-12AC]|uniref:MATE family efflux transporter n=2 Tax=Faecalibacillus TaxID=2678885 RepID=UPI000E4F69AA|nr:MATE family efflux transporter [Coprobacillus sp. AM42-12AC]
MEQRLLKENVFKALMIFALPYMFSNLLQVLYGSTDLFVVGQFGHTFDISGVSIGSQTMALITNLILGLTTGVTVLLRQCLGSKSYRDLSKIIGGAIVLFLIIALGLTFVMLSFNNEITFLMNTPKEAIEATKSYLSICSAGIIFIVGYNVVSRILRGLGDSKTPLLFVFIACMINIVLVGYFHMGAKGAAIATVSAQGFSFLFALVYLCKKGIGSSFYKEDICFSKYIQKIMQIGFPLGLQSVLVNISFLIITIIANQMGLIASASLGVVEKLMGFLMLPAIALGSALASLIALNVGAKQYKRAKQTLKYAIMISLTFAIVVTTICEIDGTILTRIFINNQDVIKNGALYLKTYSIDCLLTSFLFCINGYLNGYERTVFTMVHSLVATFVGRIPLTLLFSKISNVTLFHMGIAAPLSTMIFLVMIFIYFKKTKFDKVKQ